MGDLRISYLVFLVFLFLFGVSFFTVDFYMPHLLSWKADKMLAQSEIYLDEKIDHSSGLIEDGIIKAKIAYLLAPENEETFENYNLLLFRTKPSEALANWSNNLDNQGDSIDRRESLFKKSLKTYRNTELPSTSRIRAMKIAYIQMNRLTANRQWKKNPANALLVCELWAETGKQTEALGLVSEILNEHPDMPEAIFFLTRLSVHLQTSSNLKKIGESLIALSFQRNEYGIEAIKHLSLLHVISPLSRKSLEHCISMLKSNSHAQSIDFLRIHALLYSLVQDKEKKSAIIQNCLMDSKLDLEKNSNDLLIFSNWLARIGGFEELLEYLPATKAKMDENLFKIRMNALAHLRNTESILREVRNAPIIPQRWRLIVEARAFSQNGNFQEAAAILDRLVAVLGDDFRKVWAICEYLESSDDTSSLVHILGKLIDKPIRQRYALQKLMKHRSASAPLEDLLDWMLRLSKINDDGPSYGKFHLYLELLNPTLPSQAQRLSQLLEEAKQSQNENDTPETRITLALGHLRNGNPDHALVALGRPEDWRDWKGKRAAWSFIASQVYRLNHDSEKALVLLENITFQNMDRAEKDSLTKLFPDQSQTH